MFSATSRKFISAVLHFTKANDQCPSALCFIYGIFFYPAPEELAGTDKSDYGNSAKK